MNYEEFHGKEKASGEDGKSEREVEREGREKGQEVVFQNGR
jgi:hypothetical protein